MMSGGPRQRTEGSELRAGPTPPCSKCVERPRRIRIRRVDFSFDSGDEIRVGTKRRLISKAFLLAQEGLFRCREDQCEMSSLSA